LFERFARRCEVEKSFTVGEVARELSRQCGVKILPQKLTLLFYTGKLDEDRCQIVAKRRMIPESYIQEIRATLEARGVVPMREVPANG
jgi:hypothetical protein